MHRYLVVQLSMCCFHPVCHECRPHHRHHRHYRHHHHHHHHCRRLPIDTTVVEIMLTPWFPGAAVSARWSRLARARSLQYK